MLSKGRYNLKNITTVTNRLFCTSKNNNGNKSDTEIPPEPTTCCMSGCPNCVWVEYAEKLMKLSRDGGADVRKMILEKVQDPNMRAYLSMELKNLEKSQNSSKDSKDSSQNSTESRDN